MASTNVQTFTTENWQKEVEQSSQPVVVDFWAAWCRPCRQLAPTIDRLADQYAGRVKVGKLNVDENQDLAVKYSISGIPAVLIFKGGDQPREKLVGLQSEANFTKAIDRVLAS
jgi:thioredoxin 1